MDAITRFEIRLRSSICCAEKARPMAAVRLWQQEAEFYGNV